MRDNKIIELLQNLVDEHFIHEMSTVRRFKHIAQIPQYGEEFERNINVWELQDAAISRLDEERKLIINFLNKLYK